MVMLDELKALTDSSKYINELLVRYLQEKKLNIKQKEKYSQIIYKIKKTYSPGTTLTTLIADEGKKYKPLFRSIN